MEPLPADLPPLGRASPVYVTLLYSDALYVLSMSRLTHLSLCSHTIHSRIFCTKELDIAEGSDHHIYRHETLSIIQSSSQRKFNIGNGRNDFNGRPFTSLSGDMQLGGSADTSESRLEIDLDHLELGLRHQIMYQTKDSHRDLAMVVPGGTTTSGRGMRLEVV